MAVNGFFLGGISSFAFQGTNAHALVGKQLGAGAAGAFALPAPTVTFLAAAAVQRTRYWVLPAAHPLISSGSLSGMAGAAAAARTISFECQLLAPRLALYGDHTVFGRVLFPGAGMLEAVLASGCTALLDYSGSGGALAVSSMAISSPLVIPQPSQQEKQQGSTVMRCSLDPATGGFELSHTERPKSSVQNAAGSLALAAATAVAAAAHTMAAVAVRTLAVRRLVLGRALAALAAAPGHATGSIVADSRLGTDGYLVPPPCMDSCLHLGVAAPGCGAKVPVAVGAFTLADQHAAAHTTAGSELAGSTSAAYSVPGGTTDTASFTLRTAAGGALAGLAGLEAKVVKSKAAGQTAAAASVKAADFLYEVDWEAASHPASLAATAEQQPRAELAFAGGSAAVELAAGPLAAASAALALVQQAQGGQAPAVTAALPEVLPSGTPVASTATGSKLLGAGALEGLLRVAATEHATAVYSLTATGALAAASPAADQQQERGILSTTRVHAGVAAAPRLLPR